MEAEPTPKKPGLYIRTFGCQMNEYDSQKIEKILEQEYRPVERPQEAELVLINTCSVRDKPQQKLYSLLGQLRELKRLKPAMLIGVGGCVAQQEGEKIVKRDKSVDFVFGTHNLSLVPSLIERRKSGAPPQVAVDYRDEWEDLPAGFVNSDRVSVFVSISRGCNKNCSYCIVPITRGREVSRAPEEIEREVRIALQRGAKEVVLLGQTVNSYGLDFRPRSSFTALLRRLGRHEQLKRIRFTSPHPQEIRGDFIDLLKDNPKVCRHVHMPLQSGSDRILKLMNRNYRREKYLKIIDAIKDKVPDMAITTDIIVGFPGETDGDFEQTLEIMDRVQFDSSYSFIFSARPGTAAAAMKEGLSYEEKLQRLKILQAKQNEISVRRLTDWVGRTTEVLIDGASAYNHERMQGRNSQNLTVNLTRKYDLNKGALVECLITGISKFTLKGELDLHCEPPSMRQLGGEQSGEVTQSKDVPPLI